MIYMEDQAVSLSYDLANPPLPPFPSLVIKLNRGDSQENEKERQLAAGR